MVSIVAGEVYRLPLYTPPQAAQIVDVPPATLRNWARGYAYKTLGGVVEAFPMITTARPVARADRRSRSSGWKFKS